MTTTIKLSGGGLGAERMMIRCNLAEASAPVEVDYCNGDGEGFVSTRYQCGDARHTVAGLIEIGKVLAAEAVEMTGADFDCTAAVVAE